MSTSGFSIDIGEEYICVLDGQGSKNQFTVQAAAYEKTPPDLFKSDSNDVMSKAAQVVVKLVKDAGINKKETAIILPDSQSYTRILQMPLLTEKELISAIRYQADQFIPVPIDKISLDIETLEKNTNEKKLLILLVAAGNSLIERVTTIVESAGLIPLSVQNETSASLKMFKQYSSIFSTDQNLSLLLFINISAFATSLILIDLHKQLPLETHNFNLGLDIFRKDIRTNYSLDEKKIQSLLLDIGFSHTDKRYNLQTVLQTPLVAFGDEIKRFLVSVHDKTRDAPVKGIIYGEGSLIPDFDKQIGSIVGIDVGLMPFDQLIQKNTVSEFFRVDLPLFIASIGSCLS